ncbi:MAG: hypothetical protein JO204_16375 [Alphaproteobacteria bacterium]|nr:hypothetical protein [Alphaproteobacteria bacterium]
MDTIERDSRTSFDLARTGPGTPMGVFMRRFWMPAAQRGPAERPCETDPHHERGFCGLSR